MNTNLKMIALATALALGTPAMAQTIPEPLAHGQEHRDSGAKPAAGRPGQVATEARALQDREGRTGIEVTNVGVVAEVKAHVKALDGNRTEAVTPTTEVRRERQRRAWW